jgi:hypothetical protein
MSGSSDINEGGFTSRGLGRMNFRFADAGRSLHDRLLAAMEEQASQLALVARQRLAELFPNPTKMQNAIETQVVDGGSYLTGSVIASGLPYLRIHEYGGQTAPHDIFPRNVAALHFFSDHAADFLHRSTSATDEVFSKGVHHPGSHFPERSFMRYALAIRGAAIRDAFATAAREPFTE